VRTLGITIEEASYAELDTVSRAAGLTPAEFARRAAAAAVRLSTADGMPMVRVVNRDQMQTLPGRKLGDRITELFPAKLEEVESALLFALGFRSHK
jgi:mRNA-degrading endonuclease toxin of MazEF toxin-antitoxin module